mgnify:CR=1 FL=1
MSVYTRQCREEQTDDGEEEKFKRLEQATKNGDFVGSGGAVSGVDDKDDDQGNQGNGKNSAADLRKSFSKNGASKIGV